MIPRISIKILQRSNRWAKMLALLDWDVAQWGIHWTALTLDIYEKCNKCFPNESIPEGIGIGKINILPNLGLSPTSSC